jgi:hypothetical protein
MQDCGVALPTQELVDPLPAVLGNIQGVLDLLRNGFDITAPVVPTLGGRHTATLR